MCMVRYAAFHSVDRKMIVGILTLHNAINYGATLQALALQKYIEELGVDVEIIDYRNKHIEKRNIGKQIIICIQSK